MVGSPEDISDRRGKILRGFGKAKHLKERGITLKGKVKDFTGDYCLVEGDRTGHCNNQSQSSIPIWQWMKSIREGRKPVASFYFPDNLSGPDLLFALENSKSTKKNPLKVVLCIVQVRLPQLSYLYLQSTRTILIWMTANCATRM
jgi:hypothetical protein